MEDAERSALVGAVIDVAILKALLEETLLTLPGEVQKGIRNRAALRVPSLVQASAEASGIPLPPDFAQSLEDRVSGEVEG